MSEILTFRSNLAHVSIHQGWSLVGIGAFHKAHFICWDGATDDAQGPFILPFQNTSLNEVASVLCLSSSVSPLMSHVKYAEKISESSSHQKKVTNAAIRPHSFQSFIHQNDLDGGIASPGTSFSPNSAIDMAAKIKGGLDDIIVNALNSISSSPHKSPEASAKSMSGIGRGSKRSVLISHQEKSKRLLRQCSSWTQLDDTKANRGIVHGQGEIKT